jgi:outer membrane protein assembly factor BamB
VNKNIFIFLILILFNNCSFDTKSGIWTQEKKLTEIKQENKKINELFKQNIIDENEFNKDLIVKFVNDKKIRANINQNNLGVSELSLRLDKLLKYKFSKIEYFDQFEPELVFFNNDIIFFDKKGSIIRFNDDSKIIWKVNHYDKKERKLKPLLNLSLFKDKLLVADSLSNIYLVDLNNGKLLWKSDHKVSFISDIKIENDKFYVLDATNTFICFSLLNGKKVWTFEGENKLINSQKKKSLILDKNKVIFNNTKGEIIALNKFNGNLLWITPTVSYAESIKPYLINSSELVLNHNEVYLSNNKNSFFSIDVNNGLVNWSQNINSNLRPIIIGDLILTISLKGYLYIIDKDSGNIIRISDILKSLKIKKREKTSINGFVVDKDNIYATTSLGQIIVINLSNGKEKFIYRASRSNISKPYVNSKKLFVIKDNEIIKIN